MNKLIIRFLSPTIACVLAILIWTNIIHVNVFNIKAIDRKITSQSYNWHNGTYEWDELRRSLSWEDALVDIYPDYENQLQKDMNLISLQFDHVKQIYLKDQTIRSTDYLIKICIEDQNIDIQDSTLFKKIGRTNTSAYLELYDPQGCELLYKRKDRRFFINHTFLTYGFGKNEFINNKANELIYTEICESIPAFIWSFEGKYIWRQRRKALKSFAQLYFKDWTKNSTELQTASFSKNTIP